VTHEAVSDELELRLAQERIRKLELELREVREIADEALRIAKRAKRGVAQHP
jgi:hypothetical protein